MTPITWLALGLDCAWLIFLGVSLFVHKSTTLIAWRIKTFLFGPEPWYRSWRNWWLLIATTCTVIFAPVRVIYITVLVGCGIIIALTALGWWHKQFHVLNVLMTWLVCCIIGWGALIVVIQK